MLGFPVLLLMAGMFSGGLSRDLTTREVGPRRRVRQTTRRTRRTASVTRPTVRAPTARTTPVRTVSRIPTKAQPVKVVPVSRTAAVPVEPAPWPQVVPAGLPGFPGPGWVPDDPPGAGVVARAGQLLPVLWKHGEGTRKTEQTAGRWITYRATPMGKKRGVVAFRLKSEPTVSPVKTTPVRTTSAPSSVPARVVTPSPSVSLPTLRRGPPWRHMPETRIVQGKLGLTTDGKFGQNTERAVKAYQSSHGLVPDGVVGRLTWASLMGSGTAQA